MYPRLVAFFFFFFFKHWQMFGKRADSHYTESIALFPTVGVVRNYALFLARNGRTTEAKRHIEKAFALCDEQGGTVEVRKRERERKENKRLTRCFTRETWLKSGKFCMN
jgi:hypothetical protein